jgi:hypothetical protein
LRPQASRGAASADHSTLYATPTPPNATKPVTTKRDTKIRATELKFSPDSP